MGQPAHSQPVSLVAGLIAHPDEGFDRAKKRIEEAWGRIDLESPVWPFDFTDYYAQAMGEGLLRQFVSFEKLVAVDGLHRVKLVSNDIESSLAADSPAEVKRPVNIDPGYISHAKLVLFTTKDFSHRIYIGDGICAEITLQWRGGAFHHQSWTFPDYRTHAYKDFFAGVRERYVEKAKRLE